MKKQANTTHFFYQNGKLVTVNQGAQHRAIFRSADIPLAEQHTDDGGGLLATDDKGSVLTVINDSEEEHHAFSAYGHDPNIRANSGLLGFNGEHLELKLQCYLLGTGHHRAYSTALRRFLSADSWSPFDNGGNNTYTYCNGDPVNNIDPSGHAGLMSLFKGIGNLLHLRKRGSDTNQSPSARQISEPLPSKHSTVEKAPDLMLNNALNLEHIAHDANILANRQVLKNYGKQLEGRKISKKSTKRIKNLRTTSTQAGDEAKRIREALGVSKPPHYRK